MQVVYNRVYAVFATVVRSRKFVATMYIIKNAILFTLVDTK